MFSIFRLIKSICNLTCCCFIFLQIRVANHKEDLNRSLDWNLFQQIPIQRGCHSLSAPKVTPSGKFYNMHTHSGNVGHCVTASNTFEIKPWKRGLSCLTPVTYSAFKFVLINRNNKNPLIKLKEREKGKKLYSLFTSKPYFNRQAHWLAQGPTLLIILKQIYPGSNFLPL